MRRDQKGAGVYRRLMLLLAAVLATMAMLASSVASAADWEEFPMGTFYCDNYWTVNSYHPEGYYQYWCYDSNDGVWIMALPGGYPSYPA